jgi:hypothetical protein
VRAVWKLMLRRVRTAREPLAFLYRCDAPGVRRLLRMELVAGGDGAVGFRSTLVNESSEPTYAATWTKDEATASVCGWCARVRRDAVWVSPDEAAFELGLIGERDTQLSHGICEPCAEELRARLDT